MELTDFQWYVLGCGIIIGVVRMIFMMNDDDKK